MALHMDYRIALTYCVAQYKNLRRDIKTSSEASHRHLQRTPFHDSLLKARMTKNKLFES
jgi:hypothetical protein